MAATDRLRLAVLASGRGSNFIALHRQSADAGWPIEFVGVFSDRRKAAVLEHARDRGLAAHLIAAQDYSNRAAHDAALFEALAAVQPELIVCAGYMRIIGAAVLAPWIGRTINIHPSLLPKFIGLNTHQRALAAGECEHGASVHFVTAQLDGGPVIAHAVVPVLADDDETRLAARVLTQEHRLLPAVVELFAQRRLSLCEQRVRIDGETINAPLRLGSTGRLQRQDGADA